ncbi:MAG: hypothetical protein GY846_26445 [Deltaproteobacteria bacterium]|nr:hypothetical protein [Deltaproteobacteria bacterium]
MTSEETITKILERQGWRRQFVAAEPRLSEAVEIYKELGFQVHLEPLTPQKKTSNGRPHDTEIKCRACFEGAEGQHSIIFTRPALMSGKPVKT